MPLNLDNNINYEWYLGERLRSHFFVVNDANISEKNFDKYNNRSSHLMVVCLACIVHYEF